MSRHGYTDDFEGDDMLRYGRYRGRVASALRGERGQKMLRDTLAALDAMAEKRLIAEELIDDGEVCTLGAVMLARGLDASKFDPHDHKAIGEALDIAPCLVAEIEFYNDDFWQYGAKEQTAESRWAYMRREIERLIKPSPLIEQEGK